VSRRFAGSRVSIAVHTALATAPGTPSHVARDYPTGNVRRVLARIHVFEPGLVVGHGRTHWLVHVEVSGNGDGADVDVTTTPERGIALAPTTPASRGDD